MMSDEKAVKVGDMVNSWNLSPLEYDGCEFKAFAGSSKVQITKVPKPEVPDEPMTRGAVVTFEGNDEFIAIRFTDADDLPCPFVASYSDAGATDLFGWGEIVYHAAGRKIIVHKTVDPNEAPVKVDTYDEWVAIPEDERKKYKWMDSDRDFWTINDQSGEFGVDGSSYNPYVLEEYFPLIRIEKIDD